MIDSFTGEYGFLDNFYQSPVACYGRLVPTVEHGFQAAKTWDSDERDAILNASTPGEAKALGRRARLRSNWEEIKFAWMEDLLRQKFSDLELAVRLLATGERELVEGNTWHDNIWGDCCCPRCKAKPGQNHLGRLLMKIRTELRRSVV